MELRKLNKAINEFKSTNDLPLWLDYDKIERWIRSYGNIKRNVTIGCEYLDYKIPYTLNGSQYCPTTLKLQSFVDKY